MLQNVINNKTPLVAIIVPVYNDEDYIRTCLDSIKNQTVGFWEAWLTDDCSTDKSTDIMKEYCNADDRFHYIRNETNCGIWPSRAKGILSVSPSVKYIMFADADDYLQLNAVERAYELMEQSPVNILHFGSYVENYADMNKKAIQSYAEYLQPKLAELKGKKVFDSFVERSFEGHVWNKMFNVELLKSVTKKWGADRVLYKAEDKVMYWAICWHKDDITYRGVEDRLYNYCYGLGLEGGQGTITMEEYKWYLDQGHAEDMISEIMEDHPKGAKEYAQVMRESRLNLVHHTAKGFSRLLSADKPEGLRMFSEYWTRPLDKAWFTAALAEYTWEMQLELADAVSESKAYTVTKKGTDIRVIGTYYHRLHNGGTERVVSKLVSYWHKLGYEIVLFTDFPPEEDDYELPEYVTRVDIGYTNNSEGRRYLNRGSSLAQLLIEYRVDCMVYHSWYCNTLLYEMLICKSLNVPFIIHTHGVFSLLTRNSDARFALLSRFYSLADGVACLDDASAMWWKNFNRNTHMVLNPLTFDISKVSPAERNNCNILFCCRLNEHDKRPSEAVTIIRDLVKIMPDVKMYMVGQPESERYLERLKNRIAKLKLENNVILTGYTNNVEKYYKMCSVFLSCSPFEGFLLTVIESLAYSIPIVMYDLPYLPTVKDNPGVITVKQRDTEAAVKEIYGLFSNRSRLLEIGDKGRKHIEEMYGVDIGEQWRSIFDSIGTAELSPASDKKMMYATLIRDYYDGALEHKKLQEDFKEKRNNFNKLQIDFDKKTEDMDKLQAEFDKKAESFSKLQYEFNEKSEELNGIKIEFDKKREELDKLEGEFKKKCGELNKVQDDFDKKCRESSSLQAAFNKKCHELNKLQDNYDRKCEEANRKTAEIKNIYSSLSFKIGRFVTFIPRKLREALNKKRAKK